MSSGQRVTPRSQTLVVTAALTIQSVPALWLSQMCCGWCLRVPSVEVKLLPHHSGAGCLSLAVQRGNFESSLHQDATHLQGLGNHLLNQRTSASHHRCGEVADSTAPGDTAEPSRAWQALDVLLGCEELLSCSVLLSFKFSKSDLSQEEPLCRPAA